MDVALHGILFLALGQCYGASWSWFADCLLAALRVGTTGLSATGSVVAYCICCIPDSISLSKSTSTRPNSRQIRAANKYLFWITGSTPWKLRTTLTFNGMLLTPFASTHFTRILRFNTSILIRRWFFITIKQIFKKIDSFSLFACVWKFTSSFWWYFCNL